ncbi:hypothetical protein DSO57_1002179 [Entomophthora muscae]|uniref:Uncharacterized protein n=1 Tax=Entomophthora muscae TaxID=34485 RepID=A0ACC2T8L1_9FUNG|nr:hypothetical protein DSO57_1002179 [Entomophthora muscae]
MMVAAKQRELAKAAEAEKARAAKEEDMHRLTRLWSNDIIPNWGKPGVASRAAKIIAKGIPSSCRGQVWSRCLENQTKGGRPSALTSETYEFLLQRAYHPPPPYMTMTQRNAKLIAHDAAGVFPELGLFGPGTEDDQGKASEPGPYYTSLLNVINAHASLAPTEPYENRAIGSLAGVLLLHMNEHDAFLALQGLLCRPMHAAFALATPQASSYLKVFDLAFSAKHPRLYKHFQQAQLKSEMFLSSWIANLYTKHLSLEVCCHIWDLYLVAGDKGDEILFIVALVMLGWLEPHLYGRLDEALGYLGQPVPLTLDYLIARLPSNSNSQNSLAAVISTSTSSMSFSLPKSVVNGLKEARAESEKTHK